MTETDWQAQALTRVDQLEDRLSRFEAERGILDTMHRYARCIDYGDNAGWLDCFTADAVFEVHVPDLEAYHSKTSVAGVAIDKGVRYAGQDALRSFVEAHTSAPSAWHKHFMVEPTVHLAADAASAGVESYFARLDDREGERVISAFGRYRDRLVRDGDGRWRFSSRIAEVESVG